jgi:hypothetical protein
LRQKTRGKMQTTAGGNSRSPADERA